MPADAPNACCREDANLGPLITSEGPVPFRRCKTCKRRHFEASVEPGLFGARLSPAG